MTFPRPSLRAAGTLTATAILVFALGVAVTGAFTTRAQIKGSFDRQKRIQTAQLALEQLLKVQLDEETAVRGYTITRDSVFLDPYLAATQNYAPLDRELRATLAEERMVQGQNALHEFERVHDEWHSVVARPMIADPRLATARDLEKRGKALIDQERDDALALEGMLAERNDLVGQQTEDQVNRSLYVRAAWLVLFGALAILFNGFRGRLDRELIEERTTTETLQKAFLSEVVPLPNCTIGTAYLSASRNAAVGGDVFDVYRLSENLALLMIADVSGKGVDAAVITAFIKFTIRSIALRRREPSAILAEFNTAFPRTVTSSDMFVSMFVAILDLENMAIRYASGGHDSAFFRRADGVEQLPVTGPILGVMEEPFSSRSYKLERGETIVLTTDGLLEARSPAGRRLSENGAAEWIAEGPHEPQQLANALMQRLRRWTAGRIADDVAILTVGCDGAANSGAMCNG